MKINVAIVGVGNCAKSLVEGISFYSRNKSESIGLLHPLMGNYSASDVDFVAAFDIDKRKVGKKLSEAINAEPNKTQKIADPVDSKVIVQRGPTCNSVIPALREYFIHESDEKPLDIVQILKDSKAEIVVNYLPTGSEEATYTYAEACLEANCSFINCMPTPIAKNEKWRRNLKIRT